MKEIKNVRPYRLWTNRKELYAMRLRNVPGSRETLAASSYCFETPGELKGRWQEEFGNQNPLFIEIGMGKGKFITQLAASHPQINYIGIEKYSSVLVRALEKLEAQPLPNLRLIRMEAEELLNIFAPGEVSGIYLNFSDPWPKDRHAKRRLTSVLFLTLYRQILKPEGLVEFKTDNRPLFDFSLESVTEAGWTLLAHTFDLHHSSMAEGNVMTEYEEKFSALGNPICKLTAMRP